VRNDGKPLTSTAEERVALVLELFVPDDAHALIAYGSELVHELIDELLRERGEHIACLKQRINNEKDSIARSNEYAKKLEGYIKDAEERTAEAKKHAESYREMCVGYEKMKRELEGKLKVSAPKKRFEA
jgi:hypothetical protein